MSTLIEILLLFWASFVMAYIGAGLRNRSINNELILHTDRQGYLENRLRETEKFADGLNKHLWMLNDRLDLLECTVNKQCAYEVNELPETDIETVKEEIK